MGVSDELLAISPSIVSQHGRGGFLPIETLSSLVWLVRLGVSTMVRAGRGGEIRDRRSRKPEIEERKAGG